MSDSPLRCRPDAEHRFWMYSPEGNGLTYYSSAEKRDAAAKTELRTYLDTDSGWFEEVTDIVCGVVTHGIKEIVKEVRPDNYYELDEDERDEVWPYSDEFEEIVDYELEELERAIPKREELAQCLVDLVKSLDDLISQSDGVAGLHLNGDIAHWESLLEGGRYESRLLSLSQARAAAERLRGGGE
jgi:hypothetical protein